MSYANAIWFSVASLLQQGGEAYPKSLSGTQGFMIIALWLYIQNTIVNIDIYIGKGIIFDFANFSFMKNMIIYQFAFMLCEHKILGVCEKHRTKGQKCSAFP